MSDATTLKAEYDAGYDEGYAEGYEVAYCEAACDGECGYDEGFTDGEQEAKNAWREALYELLRTQGLPALDGVVARWDAAERCFVFSDGEREVRVK